MDVWKCPNAECNFKGTLKLGEVCPTCGTEAENLGFILAGRIDKEKDNFKKTGRTNLWYCPNARCVNAEVLGTEMKCPKCGTLAEEQEIMDLDGLLRQKRLYPRLRGKSKGILYSGDLTDEELLNRIYEDMNNLAMHEAGTAWMGLGTLLTFNSTEQMLGAGFKALIDQNKIIIRQNELMLRSLKRLEEREGASK